MTVPSRRETSGEDAASRRTVEAGSGASACLASLVLALATGMPLHSAGNFLPHSGEQATPYLGV